MRKELEMGKTLKNRFLQMLSESKTSHYLIFSDM